MSRPQLLPKRIGLVVATRFERHAGDFARQPGHWEIQLVQVVTSINGIW
jgi:hypothetical protein